jgi:hypothetical protein
MERRRRTGALAAALALLLLVVRGALAAPPGGPAPPGPGGYLIYLLDGVEPLVVKRYVEEADQIRFEKYGGWVGIPRYEVLRIVPDEPEPVTAALPPAVTGADPPLYVATRRGATLRARAVGLDGAHLQVRTSEGSITVSRADIVGVLRIPEAPAAPEAWISLVGANGVGGSGVGGGREPGDGARGRPGATAPVSPLSHRPHLLQLAGGVVIQIDGFWIEDGEIRFRRLGGVVGFALSEVARLLPQELPAVAGRLPVQFVRRLGIDRFEARAGRAAQRVRLIGVDPLPGATSLDDPWAPLEPGHVLHLEFDRQRYAPEGDWLAYVYLPSGRMLNAELIRAGLARPRADEGNLRYADLFHEIATQGRGRPVE